MNLHMFPLLGRAESMPAYFSFSDHPSFVEKAAGEEGSLQEERFLAEKVAYHHFHQPFSSFFKGSGNLLQRVYVSAWIGRDEALLVRLGKITEAGKTVFLRKIPSEKSSDYVEVCKSVLKENFQGYYLKIKKEQEASQL